MNYVRVPKLFYILILISFYISICSAPTFANNYKPVRSWQGSVWVKTLNVRAGPGEGYKIVSRLKRGDKVNAFDQLGRWIRIIGIPLGALDNEDKLIINEFWIHRSFVHLPKKFMEPKFGKKENSFLDWAIARGDLLELSIESDNRLSISLSHIIKVSDAERIALEVGCAYRKKLGLNKPVSVTVWGKEGTKDNWLAQTSCLKSNP